MPSVIPLILAFVLGILHFLSSEYAAQIKRHHTKIISFSAGILISFIFLEALPEISFGSSIVGFNIYIILLAGFASFHVVEKYFYQHRTEHSDLAYRLKELHVLGFFVNHFILGFALVLFFELPGRLSVLGYAVFIPFALHTVSSALSLRYIIAGVANTDIWKTVLSGSVFLGAITSFVLYEVITAATFYIMFAFIVGILLYIIIRDMLPQGRMGNPLFFVIGLLLSMSFLLLK